MKDGIDLKLSLLLTRCASVSEGPSLLSAATHPSLPLGALCHQPRRLSSLVGILILMLGFSRLASPSSLSIRFERIPSGQSGISWTHDSAMSEKRHLPETVGAGCAFFDYDGDGWMDIYLVNSGPADFYQPEKSLGNALYRNNRNGTFTDVTESAGVRADTFGMGAAAADYDNDGDADLLVTAYGPLKLYQNQGDGTFRDVARSSGLDVSDWTTSAVWFDYDNDGRLDLFLCVFVQYSLEDYVFCGDNEIGRNYYCIPRRFQPSASRLFRNNGDGTFSETGKGTVIEKSLGKALGVVATDVNTDGWMDLFVANDTVQNFLFINRGNQQWEELGLESEVGFSRHGTARSGMGVDAADIDGDGHQDLFVANVDQEMFSLYRNNGDESFLDVAPGQGIAQTTRLLSGWGLKFADFDNDGALDLFLANGHPDDMIGSSKPRVTYRMPLLVFQNLDGRLTNVSETAGTVFAQAFSARGLATGDFNNDGLLDVLVSDNGGAPLLLENRTQPRHNWVGIHLQGTRSSREAVGARMRWSAAGVERSLLKTSGGSYLSSHDPRVILGLGSAERLDWLEIQWPQPSGVTERWANLPVNQYVTIREGEGK